MVLKKRGLSGTVSTDISRREIENGKVSRMAARESFVLLENNGVLPLKKGAKIGLYGGGAVKTMKGGTGSGDVNERRTVSVYEGLENAGYEITSKEWLDGYVGCYDKRRNDWKDDIMSRAGSDAMKFFMTYSSTPFEMPAGDKIDKEKAKADGADAAIFVISRIAGEGADRKTKEGDYYLTAREKAMLGDICDCYKDVIVILNIGGLIDLNFIDEYKNISALIMMGQAGQEGGNALADIISGDVTPSGKLTDTWPKNYADLPSAETFSYRSGSLYKEEYNDGIYVGYRYFDTFEVPVKYCFGYGKSYTDFEIVHNSVSADKKRVALEVTVTNRGEKYTGKEVVQIYASTPQQDDTHEFRRLVAFAKTKSLLPGESQTMKISFPVSALESYDYEESGNVLRGGFYGLWIGNSLDSSVLSAYLTVENTVVTKKFDHILPLEQELCEIKPDRDALLERSAAWLRRTKDLDCAEIPTKEMTTKTTVYRGVPEEFDGAAGEMVNALTEDELIAMAMGNPRADQSALGGAGQTVPGAAAETVETKGIASMVLADGPAGIRLKQSYTVQPDGTIYSGSMFDALEKGFFSERKEVEGTKYYQFCTSIPVGSVLAQSWDAEMIKKVGAMIGGEMNEFNVTLWLAPGMNIHRNPLCGRNFEYYSEDPLVAGIMAGAMTLGVQSVGGCGTTIKHFACNNREDNRMGSDSIVSERALREIYLKGFEIAVKDSQPMSIMTSYNLINGVHAANSYDLCTKVARDEWGFAGAIMTDWTTTVRSTAGVCNARGCMKAGNDMVMPGAPADAESIKGALEDGSLSINELKKCIRNTTRIALASNQYEDAVPYSDGFENPGKYIQVE